MEVYSEILPIFTKKMVEANAAQAAAQASAVGESAVQWAFCFGQIVLET